MAFGYRIFQVSIGQPYKPDVRYDFDNVALHSGGALGLFGQALKDLIASGDADDNRSTYFKVEQIRHGGWIFSIDSSGGQYGRPRRVIDTLTNATKAPIGSNDAVVDDLPMILVVPNYGQQGLLIAAVEGRTHNAHALQRYFDQKLKPKNLSVKLVSDLADSVAWNEFLGQTDLDVTHVELIQTAVTPQRVTFGRSDRVSMARILLTISDASTKRNVLQRVRNKVTNGGPLGLTGVFGMTGLSDTDFDDYRIVYVKDGREKSLRVSADFPHFIYPLDGTAAPTPAELADAAMSDAEHLLTQMGVNYPTGWWPSDATLTVLT